MHMRLIAGSRRVCDDKYICEVLAIQRCGNQTNFLAKNNFSMYYTAHLWSIDSNIKNMRNN